VETLQPPRERRLTAVEWELHPFEVKMLDGRSLKLSDCRGKYVVLDFWATSITRWKILPSLVTLSSLKDDFVALVECAGMRLSPVR